MHDEGYLTISHDWKFIFPRALPLQKLIGETFEGAQRCVISGLISCSIFLQLINSSNPKPYSIRWVTWPPCKKTQTVQFLHMHFCYTHKHYNKTTKNNMFENSFKPQTRLCWCRSLATLPAADDPS